MSWHQSGTTVQLGCAVDLLSVGGRLRKPPLSALAPVVENAERRSYGRGETVLQIATVNQPGTRRRLMAAPGSLRQNLYVLYFGPRHRNLYVGRELALHLSASLARRAVRRQTASALILLSSFFPHYSGTPASKLSYGRPRAFTTRNRHFAGRSRFVPTSCFHLLNCDLQAQTDAELGLIILSSVDTSMPLRPLLAFVWVPFSPRNYAQTHPVPGMK